MTMLVLADHTEPESQVMDSRMSVETHIRVTAVRSERAYETNTASLRRSVAGDY